MTIQQTLPQQRAKETRRRILEAAERVFGRVGYGQTVVEEILIEAGISRGAFYHHFSGKEELFKALLDDHLQEWVMEFEAVDPGSSSREVIERFVALQIDDMEAHLASGNLWFEFMAAAREEWARAPLAEFYRRSSDVIAGALRSAQRGGRVWADLDVEAAAWLMLAVFEGVSAFKTLDPEGIELDWLKQSWGDLIERFVSPGEPAPRRAGRAGR